MDNFVSQEDWSNLVLGGLDLRIQEIEGSVTAESVKDQVFFNQGAIKKYKGQKLYHYGVSVDDHHRRVFEMINFVFNSHEEYIACGRLAACGQYFVLDPFHKLPRALKASINEVISYEGYHYDYVREYLTEIRNIPMAQHMFISFLNDIYQQSVAVRTTNKTIADFLMACSTMSNKPRLVRSEIMREHIRNAFVIRFSRESERLYVRDNFISFHIGNSYHRMPPDFSTADPIFKRECLARVFADNEYFLNYSFEFGDFDTIYQFVTS
jgi:hypothetical protein